MDNTKDKKEVKRRLRKLTVPLVRSALIESHGILSIAADKCGVTRLALTDFIKKEPELAGVVESAKERVLDLTEAGLLKAIKNSEPWAIKFMLSTQGKRRGYSERMEITGADGGAVVVKVVSSETLVEEL